MWNDFADPMLRKLEDETWDNMVKNFCAKNDVLLHDGNTPGPITRSYIFSIFGKGQGPLEPPSPRDPRAVSPIRGG